MFHSGKQKTRRASSYKASAGINRTQKELGKLSALHESWMMSTQKQDIP